jgi:hypothetical protein
VYRQSIESNLKALKGVYRTKLSTLDSHRYYTEAAFSAGSGGVEGAMTPAGAAAGGEGESSGRAAYNNWLRTETATLNDLLLVVSQRIDQAPAASSSSSSSSSSAAAGGGKPKAKRSKGFPCCCVEEEVEDSPAPTAAAPVVPPGGIPTDVVGVGSE